MPEQAFKVSIQHNSQSGKYFPQQGSYGWRYTLEEQACYNFYMQSYFPAVRQNTKDIGRHNELFKQIDLNTDILSKIDT